MPVTLTYDGFACDEEGLREALTSTGNGYFCSRGAAEWQDADDRHYPGTYCHGGYNRETTVMGGRPVLNEDLVNLPNWLVLKLRIEGEDAVRLDNVEVLEYRHSYDARIAVVSRTLRFRDRGDRETTLRSRRFVSMAHEWMVTPENWSGRLEVVSALDGRVTNHGVARYREFEGRHLDPVSPRTFGPEVIALKVKTRQSDMFVAEAARTRMFRGEEQLSPDRSLYQMEDYIQQALAVHARAGEAVRVEKVVAFYTSRDRAINEPLGNAGTSVARYPGFATGLSGHEAVWQEVWRHCDVVVPGDEHVQRLLRLHISHILQVCSRHTFEHDAGVPARGLNGEAYPRARVLGRAVRVSVPELQVAGNHARPVALPLPPAGRGPGRGRRARLAGRDVPVAERVGREGGDAGRAPQPALGSLGARPVPQPAPRERGDLLQHLALLPGHGRRRVHPRERRRDDARDRALLGFDRPLRPRARALHDRRRHGPRRVPREVPRRPSSSRRLEQQRLHERHGRVDRRHGDHGPGPAPRRSARRPAPPARAHRRGAHDLAGDEREDVRSFPRRRRDQPVRGL